MEKPGGDGGDQEGGYGVLRQIVDHEGQNVALAQGLGGLADELQRQDQQSDADEDAAELPPRMALRGQEDRRADGERDGNHQREIEAQQLDDDRGAEIGPEYGDQT